MCQVYTVSIVSYWTTAGSRRITNCRPRKSTTASQCVGLLLRAVVGSGESEPRRANRNFCLWCIIVGWKLWRVGGFVVKVERLVELGFYGEVVKFRKKLANSSVLNVCQVIFVMFINTNRWCSVFLMIVFFNFWLFFKLVCTYILKYTIRNLYCTIWWNSIFMW